MNPPQLVGLDWGSTHLRAFLFGEGGAVLEERRSEAGASRVSGSAAGFEAALKALVGDWLAAAPGLPLLACGMVGSAHGWCEARYVACPAAIDALRVGAVGVPLAEGRPLRIVPGLSLREAGGAPDVMRGEETQIAGLLALRPELAAAACVVMPGTHSKWVSLREGRVERFATHMTGELFALLREQSVLARLMQPAPAFEAEAFDEGVRAARDRQGEGLARLLFSVRSKGLFRELPPTALADYLSGLLIGSEVAGALPAAAAVQPLVLVGEAALCARYRRALALHDRSAEAPAENLCAAGLWALAQVDRR